MSKRNGEQKGPQEHAEGQHGSKTHARFLEQLHEGRPEQQQASGESHVGGRELAEGRKQHDEAERNSQATRARIEIQRGNLDPNDPDVKRGQMGTPDHGASHE